MQELEYEGRWNIETLRVDDKACMRRGFYWWSDSIKTVHSLDVADQIYLQRIHICMCIANIEEIHRIGIFPGLQGECLVNYGV